MRALVVLAALTFLPGCKVAANATDYIQFGSDGCGQTKDTCHLAPCIEASAIPEPEYDPGRRMCNDIYELGQNCWPLLRCERQTNGQCGLTPTAEFQACYENEQQQFGI